MSICHPAKTIRNRSRSKGQYLCVCMGWVWDPLLCVMTFYSWKLFSLFFSSKGRVINFGCSSTFDRIRPHKNGVLEPNLNRYIFVFVWRARGKTKKLNSIRSRLRYTETYNSKGFERRKGDKFSQKFKQNKNQDSGNSKFYVCAGGTSTAELFCLFLSE